MMLPTLANYKERDLQKAVARLLDVYSMQGFLAWSHPPNEAKRSPQVAAMLKAEGMKSGEADCIIYPRNRQAFFIELKMAGGSLNTNQKNRKAHLEGLGFKYYVVKAANPFDASRMVDDILKGEGVIT